MKIKTALTVFFLSASIFGAKAQTDLDAQCDSLQSRAKMETLLLKLSFNNFLNKIETSPDDSLALYVFQLGKHFPFLKNRIESIENLKTLIHSRTLRDYYQDYLNKPIIDYYNQRIGILRVLEPKLKD